MDVVSYGEVEQSRRRRDQVHMKWTILLDLSHHHDYSIVDDVIV